MFPVDPTTLNIKTNYINVFNNENFAKAIAERINGGSFYDNKFYTEEQRDLWRDHAKFFVENMDDYR